LYPAVGLNAAGEKVRLLHVEALWGIETENETPDNTAEAVCLSVMLH